jgi:hypothetical protein
MLAVPSHWLPVTVRQRKEKKKGRKRKKKRDTIQVFFTISSRE